MKGYRTVVANVLVGLAMLAGVETTTIDDIPGRVSEVFEGAVALLVLGNIALRAITTTRIGRRSS